MALHDDVKAILDRGVADGGTGATVAPAGDDVKAILDRGVAAGAGPMTVDSIGDLRVGALPTAMPELTNDAEFFPGIEKSWSLTFQINEEPLPTGRPAGGLMWAGMANSYCWIDIDNQVAGTYISRQFPFADARTYRLCTDIETAAYNHLGQCPEP